MYSKPPPSLSVLANWWFYRLVALCAFEFPLVGIEDRPATAASTLSAIPPIVYQTWSSNRVGRTHARQIARFRALNPDLAFVLYDDAAVAAYMDAHWAGHPIHAVFEGARYAQLAADVFRYCLLYERGGFYFDISKGLSVPIASLLAPDSTALITYEHRLSPDPKQRVAGLFHDNIAAQYGFGFAKGHALLGLMIENICAAYPKLKGAVVPKPKAAILAFTGPDMFTETLRQYLARGADPALVQAGVDFGGAAIWKMKGSYVRFFSAPPYKLARDDVIVT